MASITVQERTTILKLVAGMFNAAPGATYLNEFTDAFVALNKDFGALAAALGNTAPFQSLYPSYLTAEEFANKFLATLGLKDNAEAQDWVQARKNAGEDNASIIFQALVAIEASTADEFKAARDQLANKALVAEHYSVTLGQSSDSLATLQGVVASITADPKTVEDAIGNTGGNAGNFTLTHLTDYLTGTAGDDVFQAPVSQNGTGSGVLANTFETGDVIDGGAGRNTLKADLIATGTVGAGNEVAISATTKNIQEVYLRQQSPQTDAAVNNSTIDAEKMAGVEQWWSDNSRSNIQVEDIRTDTAATTFGMRLTDPGVSFFNYFNALFLEGDKSATSAVTLNIYEGPAGAPDTAKQLQDISVREINFLVGGETVKLSTDAMKAANTWAELETAIVDALAAIPGAETITVTNRGNGQFVLEDSAAREFQVNAGEALVVSVANNITFTNALTVGREEVVGPIVSNAVLDGAGNGSQGGTLNIGAMSGLRGVEELNLTVDRDSHLQSITSFNRVPGQYNQLRNGEANEFLEVVDLASTGANGDLTVGRSTANLDGRVATWGNAAGVVVGVVGGVAVNSGFVNLREFNAGDFAGALNVAFTLDNNVDSRYLKSATEAVTFKYTGGAQNDIFNIADVSTIGISNDQDFAMQVDLGAGDDRLILNVPTVRAVSVDGGEGTNSIVVANSHGTNAANTFAGFANFQTYEVEGNVAATQHDFTSMSGVQNVIIATNGGVNTQLIDLEAAQNVTVSGKNQTIGNASTADQNFGTITLTNDAGADRTITLDNTARLSNSINGVRQDGVLTVNNLTIDTNPATAVGATKTVTIESEGNRTSANAIAQFNGRDVEKLNLVGTQDLTINVNQIADQAANLAPGTNTSTRVDVDASGLTGNLSLALNGAMLNNFGTTPPVPAQQDTIVGTAGANDTVMFYGALNPGNNTRATGIETVQLGSAGAGTAVNAAGATVVGGSAVTMYGDLQINAAAAGTLNVANLGVSNYVLANLGGTLDLNSLSSGSTVTLGDAARNVAGDRVAAQSVAQQINLVSSATNAASTQESVTIHRLGNIASDAVGVAGTNIAVGDDAAVGGVTVAAGAGGFKTINLVVDHAINQTANESTLSNIVLAVGSQARTLNITGGTSPTNVSAQAAQAEIQTISLGATTATAGDTVTVAGITTAALAGGDGAGAIAAALTAAAGVGGLAAAGIASITAAGTDIVVTYLTASGNVAPVVASVTPAVGSTLALAAPVTTQEGRAAAVAQQADVIDLTVGGNELANSLEKIDLSGFAGQVVLAMESGVAAGQTDVTFNLSAYNAEITLSTDGAAGVGTGSIAGITHNSVFDFNGAGSVQVPTQWTVHNIVNAEAAGAGVNNNTLFDVRDLGINNYAELKVLYVADGDITVDAYGNTLAAGTAVVRAEAEHLSGNVTWEIIVDAVDGAILTGVGANGLAEANFGF